MDCGVCIGGNDYDPWEFYSLKIVRAKKCWRCYECSREIRIGERYEYIAGKYSHGIEEYRTCLDCMNIRNGLSCDGGVEVGNLWENIENIFGQVTTGCLTKIKTPSAKAYFLERWRKWKGLDG